MEAPWRNMIWNPESPSIWMKYFIAFKKILTRGIPNARWAFGVAAKPRPGTTVSHLKVTGAESLLCSAVQLPANGLPGSQQVMVKVLSSLPSTWKIRMEFRAPGFNLSQAWCGNESFRGVNQYIGDLSKSISNIYIFLSKRKNVSS